MHDYAKLLAPVSSLDGVGEKTEKFLHKIGVKRVFDLLLYLPYNVINYKKFPKFSHIHDKDRVALLLKPIDLHQGRRVFEVNCKSETFFVKLLYFNFHPSYLISKFQSGKNLIVIGTVDKSRGDIRIAHPDKILPENAIDLIPENESQYHATLGLNSNQIAKYIEKALNLLPEFEEWIDPDIISQKKWPSFKKSLINIHHPKSTSEIQARIDYRERLAYDEFLAHQLAINLVRHFKSNDLGREFEFSGFLMQKALEKLNFTLTQGQSKALEDIFSDQRSKNKMHRLIQGDVGSGKTLVALCAMLNVLESGKTQVCLMAPTDVLATQHYNFINSVLCEFGITVELLTGKITGKKRERILNQLKENEIQILIGTHALFQENVVFADLALIVIDEQHRFGVKQRAMLGNKGNKADIIVMSATPIPRTLTLALYGDLELSRIMDKPKGRLEIKTSMMSIDKSEELIASLSSRIANGDKIYWICPLVESKEDADFFDEDNAAVIARHQEFKTIFGNEVGLVHGKLKEQEKEEAIQKFASSEYKILVATTVIEVGIDVKDANIIIIEQAEKFGLAQLHQLRGRVGRGSKQSYCILLYSKNTTYTSLQRLKIIKSTNDGFVLADEDLKIRGSGDLAGTKQSGLMNFIFSNFIEYPELLEKANEQAKNIVKQNPHLSDQNGQRYKSLIKLFGYDSSILQA